MSIISGKLHTGYTQYYGYIICLHRYLSHIKIKLCSTENNIWICWTWPVFCLFVSKRVCNVTVGYNYAYKKDAFSFLGHELSSNKLNKNPIKEQISTFKLRLNKHDGHQLEKLFPFLYI